MESNKRSFKVQCPRMKSNICLFRFMPQANCLTFPVHSDAAESKIYQSAVKIVIYNFWSITRNITRYVIISISHWFIWFFDEPGFLLIRRQVIELQLEEPPKKASSKAVLFPFIRNWLSRWGPLGDFLPSNFIELLHVYYTVDGMSQEALSQPEHHRSDIISSRIGALPSGKFIFHSCCWQYSKKPSRNFRPIVVCALLL